MRPRGQLPSHFLSALSGRNIVTTETEARRIASQPRPLPSAASTNFTSAPVTHPTAASYCTPSNTPPTSIYIVLSTAADVRAALDTAHHQPHAAHAAAGQALPPTLEASTNTHRHHHEARRLRPQRMDMVRPSTFAPAPAAAEPLRYLCSAGSPVSDTSAGAMNTHPLTAIFVSRSIVVSVFAIVILSVVGSLFKVR